MAPEISQSDLVYTFFHPLLRDQQNADIHLRKVKGIHFFSQYGYLIFEDIVNVIIIFFISWQLVG